MKRFLWVSPILLVLISVCASADSVTIFLAPASPDESNFFFVERQQGIFVEIAGTTPESFYSPLVSFAPGSTFGGVSEVFVDGGLVKINGVSYENLGEDIGSLFISSFTFPTNGKDFTTRVQASFSVDEQILGWGVLGINGTASGKVTFKFDSALGLYEPSRMVLTTVPEPATLGLVGIGLTGIFAFARKELKRIHQTAPRS
jgi:PEP-CTERM motif